MIKYASNEIIFASIDIFAFMINYDFESKMSFDSISSSESARERILQIKKVNIAKKMKEMIEFITRKLVKTQEDQKINVNKKRALASNYKEDDLV
jgi:hypothetical protein